MKPHKGAASDVAVAFVVVSEQLNELPFRLKRRRADTPTKPKVKRR